MSFRLETERLIIRHFRLEDLDELYDIESDPKVHEFIEQNPILSKDEMHLVLERNIKENRIYEWGRWAVVSKETGILIGVAGIVYHKVGYDNRKNYYNLGYRFNSRYWGQGFASEAVKCILGYAFMELQISEIMATTMIENVQSISILKNIGFKEDSLYDWQGKPSIWFIIKRTDFILSL